MGAAAVDLLTTFGSNVSFGAHARGDPLWHRAGSRSAVADRVLSSHAAQRGPNRQIVNGPGLNGLPILLMPHPGRFDSLSALTGDRRCFDAS